MTRPDRTGPILEFDVVGVTVGVALVSGALSIVVAFLLPLTLSLGALALAGWAAGVSSTPRSVRSTLRRADWAALGILALGGGVALTGPYPLLPYRGLILGVSLVPLWIRAGNLHPGAR